jgi:hypothetical protein
VSVLLAAALALGGGNDFTIVIRDRIGPFGYWPPARYGAAVAAFGPPTSTRSDSNLCHVRWAGLGLELGFASEPSACTSAHLRRSIWFGAAVRDRRWHTARGLCVGDTLARARSLYPRAFRRSATLWSLVRGRGTAGVADYLEAVTRGGRVIELRIPSSYTY